MTTLEFGRTSEKRGEQTITTTVKPYYQMAVCRCGKRHHHEGIQRIVHRSSTAFMAKSSQRVDFFDTATKERCECGRRLQWKGIKGHKNSTPCSVKCTHSKGFVCDCSCGGANHGRGEQI